MNLLLVDDQKIDRELIKQSLISSGTHFNITEANDAQDCLHSIENERYDIILMDYQMPKMNGIEVLLKLNQKETPRQAAIIMISHSNNEDIMLACIEAGAQDFLLKNEVTSNKLLRSIRQSRRRFELEDQLYQSFRRVKDLAEHDQLTGLCNRYHFEQSLQSLLASSRALQGHVVVMLMDLDNFKVINDSFGHAIGDKLLVGLADRISDHFRESKLFARLGGDEFAFVFTGIKKTNDVYAIADRILCSFERPFSIEEHIMYCSGSVGISINSIQGNEFEELIKFADIAMYRAKQQGKNQACVFEENMECEFYRCYKIENELRSSIKAQEFNLNYQPIYEAVSHQLLGFEALIRWPAGKTTKNPEEFIPIAEQSRLIEPLGRWILTEGIEQLASWSETTPKPLCMAINLSPYQIHDLNLLAFIKSLNETSNINASKLVLEITETALLQYSKSTLEILQDLRDYGCVLALDDFGTGYSSISHLLDYPIDIVKFDKSLIEGAVTHPKHRAVLQGLASMFRDLAIATVAEGVETIEQVRLCELLGVNRLQGYYFNCALTPQECEKLIRQAHFKPKSGSN